ncbi:MAG: EAL domain-containing protein [Alphaproteobacteria bacterium]|nr:EAL domain-containing protein [Alphaproteobacteria bacterium]
MSRSWEVEDGRLLQPDPVREQDFILRVRRMQRLGTPHLAVNIALQSLPFVAAHLQVLESMHKALQEFARVTNAHFAEMSNGDVFLSWENTASANAVVDQLVAVIDMAGKHDVPRDNYLHIYHMPADYTALRERINSYIELLRSSSPSAAHETAAARLHSNEARGPLTAWGVDQIDHLLSEIDIAPYAQRQAICAQQPNGIWKKQTEECYVSFTRFRKERFPKLDIDAPTHLFQALCEVIDTHLIAHFANHYDVIKGLMLNFNLSVSMVPLQGFTQFVHSVPESDRKNIGFEIHRSDLFQDVGRTLEVVDELRRFGFRVILDSVTPNLLALADLSSLRFDAIKVNVSEEKVGGFDITAARQSLSKIPPEKLIFFRCDNPHAFKLGRECGVSLYQGWLVDEQLGAKRG